MENICNITIDGEEFSAVQTERGFSFEVDANVIVLNFLNNIAAEFGTQNVYAEACDSRFDNEDWDYAYFIIAVDYPTRNNPFKS